MNIGIDARVLEKRMTGVGRLLLEFMRYLPELDSKNNYFLFSYNAIEPPDPFFQSVQTIPAGSRLKLYAPFWNLMILPKFLKKYDIDILFSPNTFAPFRTRRSKWKSVVVVHDTFSKLKERYHTFWYNAYINLVIPVSIRQSSAIVTVSQNSKADICKYYGTSPDKIFLTYESVDARFKPRSKDELPLNRLKTLLPDDGKFVLYVGMIENRKNIKTMIQVADLLKERGIKAPILLVGQAGAGSNSLIPEVQKRDNMIYLSYIEDDLLPYLYNAADVFLFPSLYEGFGIPPLEAMQSGTPVVAAATSSLPEVVGEGGILCDPYNVEGYVAALTRLLTDPAYHAEMRGKALRQAQKFDQRSPAEKLVAVLHAVGGTSAGAAESH